MPVLLALRGVERWRAASWLLAGHPDLEGRSPLRALREGAEPSEVVRAAMSDVTDLDIARGDRSDR